MEKILADTVFSYEKNKKWSKNHTLSMIVYFECVGVSGGPLPME